MAGDLVAASGTLVASVLETAGYHYQAYVLENLRDPFFKGSVGGFIYLIGVVVAIFHTAMRGAYKFGPWLLIGPPLFFSMVIPTSPVPSVLWKFAQQGRDQARVEAEFKRLQTVNPGSVANVSTVFARYNKLISTTVEEIVRILNREKTQTDRWFLLRAELLGQMNTHTVETAGLKQLIQHALFTKCGALVSAAQITTDPTASDNRRKAAGEELKKLNLDTITFKPTRAIAEYLWWNIYTQGEPDGSSIACVNGLNTAEDIEQQSKLTCKCIWMFVYDGLLNEAKNTIKQAEDIAALNGIDRDQIMESWAKAMRLIPDGPSSPGAQGEAAVIDAMTKAIAKYILRNESANQTFAGFISESAEKSAEFGTIQAPLENNLALTEYARMRQSEWVEKTRLMTAATNLPYYQGLLLFFLAMGFPFFALLLLVPGKHAGFIQWFVLWLWVKSWDIGFAVVMQLDDILFSMVGITQENLAKSVVTQNQLQADFQTAMFALKQSDPTFQLATYYNIIAVCLGAIPVVSSQLIIGSLSGGVGVVAQGIKALGDDFGSGASNTVGQQVVSTMRHKLQDNIQARASLYYRNISQYDLATGNLGPGKAGELARRGDGGGGFAQRAIVGRPQPGVRMSGGMRPQEIGAQNIHYAPNTGGANPRDSNRTLEDMNYTLADIQRAHRLSKSIQGLAGGLASKRRLPDLSVNGRMPTKFNSYLDALRAGKEYGDNALLSPLEKVYRAQGDYFASIGEAHIEPAVRWATWDAYYGEEGQNLAAMARLWNMLEVPWTAGDTPEIAEGKLEYAYLDEEAKLYGSYLEAVGDSQASFLNWTQAMKMIPRK